MKHRRHLRCSRPQVCEAVSISVNRNSVPGDKSALSPGGCRVGTPAMTTRGMKEADFVQVRRQCAGCSEAF